jgi:cell division protein FtsQ
MAVFGKRGGGAGVLEAPEEDHAQKWETPEPAPAGMLQRRRMQEDEAYAAPIEDEVYKPRRESLRYRLQMGVPKSVAGRIVAATLILLLVGVAMGAVWLTRSMLLHDPRFAIATSSEIQLQGNRHLTREQVLSVFGADLERNIFKVPLTQRRADLERLPWVKTATVMRLLPNIVRVAVTERAPVAFVRDGSQIGLVDADGVLLDMPQDVAGDPRYSFPVITGLAQGDTPAQRTAKMDVYKKFMTDLDSDAGKGAKPSQSISEVDVSNPEDVKALLASGSMDIVVHFGDENFLKRYDTLEQNLAAWKAQYPKLASVDTRYENQFVLEMQAGTPVPMSAPGQSFAAAGSAAATSAAKLKPASTKPQAQAKLLQANQPQAKQPLPVKTAPSTKSALLLSAKQPAAPASTKPAATKPVAAKPAATRPAGKSVLSKEQVAAMLAAARSKR